MGREHSVPCLRSETWSARFFALVRGQQIPPLRCGMTAKRTGHGKGNSKGEGNGKGNGSDVADFLVDSGQLESKLTNDAENQGSVEE